MPGTVSVACKIPNGLHLRLFKMEDAVEPVLGGGFRPTKRAVEIGERVTVNGFSHPINKRPTALVVGGYAITPGVDADFFKEWLAQNAETKIVKNKLIFAHANEKSAEAQAKEQASVKSGLEPIDQDNLPKGIEKAKV